MKYMGSKNNHAKHILPIILHNRKPGQIFYDLFCGGANICDKVNGPVIANDINPYLIALLQYVQSGGELPNFVSEKEYKTVKNNIEYYPLWYVGFVGFCCSFGAKWFGGYARNARNVRKDDPNSELLNSTSRLNYCAESKRNLTAQSKNLKHIKFINAQYYDIDIIPGNVVYLDPPYEGATGYKNKFDHLKFWDFARNESVFNEVFISEYTAPEDFICIWSKPTKANFSLQNDVDKTRIEKLFVHDSRLPYYMR